MTWTDIEPFPSPGGGHGLSPVMMLATAPSSRYRARLIITLRPDLWEGPFPEWIKPGAKVRVQLGSGTEAGQLRIVPGGQFTCGKLPRTNAIQISIPPLKLQQPGKQKPLPCDFDFNDGWISVMLPSWCKPKPAVPQPALSPEAEARLARTGLRGAA